MLVSTRSLKRSKVTVRSDEEVKNMVIIYKCQNLSFGTELQPRELNITVVHVYFYIKR